MYKPRLLLILLLTGISLFALSRKSNWWIDQQEPLDEIPDARGELEKLLGSYSIPSLRVSGTVRLYDGELKNMLKEEQPFLFNRLNNEVYMKLGPVETFLDGKWMVQLDPVQKFISASLLPEGAMEKAMAASPLDQILPDTSHFALQLSVTQQGQDRVLALTNEIQPELKSCQLFYDPLTYRLRKVRMELWKEGFLPGYSENNKFWITETDYRYSTAEELKLPEKVARIFRIEGGQARLMPAYKNYQFDVSMQ